MSRSKHSGEYGHKPARTAPAKHRRGRSHRFGEACAVGAVGFAGLVTILYASSLYTQW
ncbi:hypothetical protein WMO79_19895 [Micrococcaceae bacterium Sec7.4]